MTKTTTRLLLAASLLALAACGGGNSASTVTTTETATTTNTETAAAAPAAAGEITTTTAGQPMAPECVQYVNRVQRCITAHPADSSVPAMRNLIDYTRDPARQVPGMGPLCTQAEANFTTISRNLNC